MGIPTLISTSTASNAASIDITSGIDSTYDEYMFVFTDMNPVTDAMTFTFNMSIDGGSNYNVTKTDTTFIARHNEDDSSSTFGYSTADDKAQSTDYSEISVKGVGNGADECCAGILHLFNPSSTTFVKHFYSRVVSYQEDSQATDGYCAGYGNTTSAVDAVSFQFTSGNMDGVIQMYGIA